MVLVVNKESSEFSQATSENKFELHLRIITFYVSLVIRACLCAMYSHRVQMNDSESYVNTAPQSDKSMK